ncbi:hypothetical protein BDZ89DRAFT_1202735, partial [Hymenopellis radicata]
MSWTPLQRNSICSITHKMAVSRMLQCLMPRVMKEASTNVGLVPAAIMAPANVPVVPAPAGPRTGAGASSNGSRSIGSRRYAKIISQADVYVERKSPMRSRMRPRDARGWMRDSLGNKFVTTHGALTYLIWMSRLGGSEIFAVLGDPTLDSSSVMCYHLAKFGSQARVMRYANLRSKPYSI